MDKQPEPYTCKHGCERDQLKNMILTQATEAAKAATYYAASKGALQARIATLEAELAGAREAALEKLDDARIESYRQGLGDAAAVVDSKAKGWQDFAAMGLPAMPSPIVCKAYARELNVAAAAIRAHLKEKPDAQ